MTNTNWQERAACRGHDPRLFDPIDGRELRAAGPDPSYHYRIHQAVAICRTCPVRAACGEEADLECAVGVRGGEYRRPIDTTPAATARRRDVRRRQEVTEDARFLARSGMVPSAIAARLGVSEPYVRGLLGRTEAA